MKAVVQRCKSAKVTVDNKVTGCIDCGLVVLLGVGVNDTIWDVKYLAKKIAGLRIFEDEKGLMNKNVQSVDGGILVISNFTLYGNVYDGYRPSFVEAMMPKQAEDLYNKFVEECKNYPYKVVQTGIFGADMKLELINDGPITILIESEKVKK